MESIAIDQALNLGVAGFTTLILWKMYKSAAEERKRYEERSDKKEESFRALEEQVRTNITAQLTASTSALYENSKLMERVIDKISKI